MVSLDRLGEKPSREFESMPAGRWDAVAFRKRWACDARQRPGRGERVPWWTGIWPKSLASALFSMAVPMAIG